MNKTNLVLHCGAAAVPFEQLEAVATPEATETWHPIPHTSLIEQVKTGLATLNLNVVQEAHALTRGGNRYFGLLQISRDAIDNKVAESLNKSDYAYVLGLRNTHDKSFPAGVVVGSQVFVCDNLAFSGEIHIARRHTAHIMRDLPLLVSRAVGLLSSRWNRMDERIEAYKQSQLSDSRVHDIVIRSLDAGACVARQIPSIVEEWRKPKHPEFEARTAWSLFNAYTEVAKGGSLGELPVRTTRLHGLLDAECGLIFKDEVVTADLNDSEVTVRG